MSQYVEFSTTIRVYVDDLKAGAMEEDLLAPESALVSALGTTSQTFNKWVEEGHFASVTMGKKYLLQKAYTIGSDLLKQSILDRKEKLDKQFKELN